jgi:hypothetical protein
VRVKAVALEGVIVVDKFDAGDVGESVVQAVNIHKLTRIILLFMDMCP